MIAEVEKLDFIFYISLYKKNFKSLYKKKLNTKFKDK